MQFASHLVIGQAHRHRQRDRGSHLHCSSWRWSSLGEPIGIVGAIARRIFMHAVALFVLKLLAARQGSWLPRAFKRLLATYRSSKVHRLGITLA